MRLTQQIFSSAVNTKQLPETCPVLAKKIPSIFDNHCFNEENLTFFDEVKATEVGHLLEHLVLEYLKNDLAKSYKYVCIRGETCWLKRDLTKYFIEIECQKKHQKKFDRALKRAIAVLERIYQESEVEKMWSGEGMGTMAV